ncbi:MAG TPA: redoxin domain-containing protein [Nitrospiria bacterium]|jgi:cytochrome c biogenesis protein CcmG/thiol:disulfide interchange protein DsbE|nr:redoxin domain-containing protein [Nitrospiria bacterium]
MNPEKQGFIRGWHITLVIGVFGLLALFYQGLWGDPRALPTVLIGTPAPAFVGPELYSGEPISLAGFHGKVVVINFWASWCEECKLEHANLLKIYERFSKNPNFVMLGIDYQDREDDAKEYLRIRGSNFKHIRDLKGTIAIDYGVYGVPETFVFDPQGIIRHKQVGPILGPTYDKLTDQIIQPLLQGQPLQTS